MSYLNPISEVKSCATGAMTAVAYVVSTTVQKTVAVTSAVINAIGSIASRVINGTIPAFKGVGQSYGAFYAKSPVMAVVSSAAVVTAVAYVACQRFGMGNLPKLPALFSGNNTAESSVAAQEDAPVVVQEDAPVVAQEDAPVVAQEEVAPTNAPVVAQEEVAPTNAPVVAEEVAPVVNNESPAA